MTTYQKRTLIFGAAAFFFVAVKCSSFRVEATNVHSYQSFLATFPYFTQRNSPGEVVKDVNDTSVELSLNKTKASTSLSNSRKFQERKLDFDPDMDDENFLLDPPIEMQDVPFSENNKLVVESSSDLVRSRYSISQSPKTTESVYLQEHEQAGVNETSENATRSVLDLLGPSVTDYAKNRGNYIAKNETEIRDNFETPKSINTVLERPTNLPLEKQNHTGKPESNQFFAKNNSFQARPLLYHTYPTKTFTPHNSTTSEIKFAPEEPKNKPVIRLNSNPAFQNAIRYFWDANLKKNNNLTSEKIPYQNNILKRPNYSVAAMPFPIRAQENHLFQKEKYNEQPKFSISSVHSDNDFDIGSALAAASVIFIVALTGLLAGTAVPFLQDNFFRVQSQPPIPFFSIENPMQFGRRPFSHFHSPSALMEHSFEEPYPYNSGLRRKRHAQQN